MLLLALILICAVMLPASVSALSIEADRLESFFDGIMVSHLDDHNINAATLSVVKDGELLISKGYGYADLEQEKTVDPQLSLFRPGSISKLFTWTAVMQLVEAEKLDLYTDLNTYLDFELPTTLVDNREVRPITIKDLLTHRPGFEDIGEGLFVTRAEEMLSLEEYLHQYLPARVFPPGEVLAYSNYGTALAGYIVEQVSGQSFAEYVEKHIFEPLGMEHSTFRQPLPEELASEMTRAYNYHHGHYHEGGFEYISAYPAGSLSSTAHDMARFMIAHLEQGEYDGRRILEEDTAREMHRQQFTHHPEIEGMTLGFIEKEIEGEEIIGHNGATCLFFSNLYLLPEHNLGIILSYNGGSGMEGTKLFQAFMKHYFSSQPASFSKPSPEEREAALAYTGNYHPNRSNFTNLEKLLGVTQRINVNVDQDGYLELGFMGDNYHLVEIETGVYQNTATRGTQLIDKLAFTSDHEGQKMLVMGGPTTYSRVPWYGSSPLLAGLTLFAILLIVTTLTGWTVSLIVKFSNNIRGKKCLGGRVARLIFLAYALTTIIFLFGLVSVFTSINPAYGVPDIMLNITGPIFYVILSLPYLIAVLSIAMLVFTPLAWIRKYWTIPARLHYSLVTISALGLVWVMVYTKLL